MKKQVYAPLIIAGTLGLDLLSKHYADLMIEPYEPVVLTPFFRLVNVENTGAAFSMLSTMGSGFFITVATFAITLIVYLLLKTNENPVALSLILGGAIGNLIDRLMLGHVRDFLDFHMGDKHWPAFNVADSALTIGLVIMLISTFSTSRKSTAESKTDKDAPNDTVPPRQ